LIDIVVILTLDLPVSHNNNKKSRNIIKRQESERKRARVQSARGVPTYLKFFVSWSLP